MFQNRPRISLRVFLDTPEASPSVLDLMFDLLRPTLRVNILDIWESGRRVLSTPPSEQGGCLKCTYFRIQIHHSQTYETRTGIVAEHVEMHMLQSRF